MTEDVQPKKNNKLVLAAVAVLVLALAGGGGWFWWQQSQANTVALKQAQAAEGAAVRVKKPIFQPMTKFVVSVQGDQHLHYLMLEIALMGYDQAQMDLLTDYTPLIRNTVISAVSQKAYEDLTAQNAIPALEAQLLTDIRNVMQSMAGSSGLDKVLITKMVIQ
ncbi:hypothetical protein ABT56_08190 [Photobacterium aquae]|uniref:Flagellar protein FliL n=1 Tax=Photobacterium aquae TaxID=1195763 RepID=A0A0J1H4F2_9GAMM|nr:flagellar basal body-associated FliL family protein [Photobacterium aquae]KLV06599.1 hypothetical protein ABT56_08190 [Photobacterium aquae]